MSTKIKPADQAFSRCIRQASNWTCQRCGTQYEEGSQGLHCSHNFSRRHRTIRWCKENALALCFSCHQWFGGNPADSGNWLIEFIGEGSVDLLREKRDSKQKVSKQEEKDIAAHYRKQLKLMKEGDQDDFESWQ